ncbi:hypothetical protein EAE96_007781 [Botrytis aclada]|nr:hypothetical protein EAE96_007781 [Botrytis aclada]
MRAAKLLRHDLSYLTWLNQQSQSQSRSSTIDVDIEASCLLIVSLTKILRGLLQYLLRIAIRTTIVQDDFRRRALPPRDLPWLSRHAFDCPLPHSRNQLCRRAQIRQQS